MSIISSNAPSALYRRQIKNITTRMHDLTAQTILYPLRSMAAFHKAENDFAETKDAANLCCSVMDGAQSIENEDRATTAATTLMTELVQIKNDASDMVEEEVNETLENRRKVTLPKSAN